MSLLIQSQPLVVLTELAVKIGLNEAIFLQQVHFWLEKSTNIKNGHKWVYNSYPEWRKQFPFWSVDTIKRTVHNLEKIGLLISDSFNKMTIDKTKWYRIDYAAVERISPTMGAKCTDDGLKLPPPIPENTTEITTTYLAKSEKPLKRETEIPKDLTLDADMEKFASSRGVRPQREFEAFVAYHTSKGSKFKDWKAAWRTWVLNSVKFSKKDVGAGVWKIML